MCSTTPKTKAANPAVTEPAKIAKQGGGGGGGGTGGGTGGGSPAALKFEGVQEHVPDLTFIIEPRVAGDDYLASATAYHTNCGMKPQEIHSIDHLVGLLAASATALKRIRIVGHATGEDLIIPLFGQTDVREDRHAFKDDLNAFAISDEHGLLNLFSLTPGLHLSGWVMTDILTMVRGANNMLLEPFGLRDKGVPDIDELKKFILYSCDYAFVNRNFYKKNNGALNAAEKSGMLTAYRALIWLKGKAIKGTVIGGNTVTQAQLDALSDHLKERTAADLNLTAEDSRNYTMPAGALNTFLLAGRAGSAIIAGFRELLVKARKRFSSTSSIDIRGCRAGDDRDYLRAVQEFLGDPASKPSVTAPTWYQAFAGTNSYSHPATRAQVHTLLHNGAPAAGIRSGFEKWATMSHVDPDHKQVWLDALGGEPVKFVLLEWRKKLAALPVPAPGLTTYLAMNFVDFIRKSADFFNVPAAGIPADANLTTMNTFISSKLNTYATSLLAFVDGATTQTKLNTIHTGLDTINIELGNPVTPVPVAPAGYKVISDYQEKLVKHIGDNQLSAIKPFITAVRDRINDTTDPGMNYYMLFGGMPVFVFSNREVVTNHQVNVRNNRLVVLDAFADVAFRAWAQLSWAQPMPAGNLFGTLHPADFTSRRSMMMVELPTGGNSPAAVCPHEDYFQHITSV